MENGDRRGEGGGDQREKEGMKMETGQERREEGMRMGIGSERRRERRDVE